MNAIAKNATSVKSGLAQALMVAVFGIGIVFVAGHLQASALHDAAHDVRHATGFPCH